MNKLSSIVRAKRKETLFTYLFSMFLRVMHLKEKFILDAAKKSKRSRLYYLLLALLDTGARPSELYPVNESNEDTEITFEPVRWRDFFEHNFEIVQLVSYKGKERKIRLVPVTERLKTALLALWQSLKC